MYLIDLTIYSNGNPVINNMLYFINIESAKEYIKQNFPDFIEAGDNFFVKEEYGETRYLIMKRGD